MAGIYELFGTPQKLHQPTLRNAQGINRNCHQFNYTNNFEAGVGPEIMIVTFL